MRDLEFPARRTWNPCRDSGLKRDEPSHRGSVARDYDLFPPLHVGDETRKPDLGIMDVYLAHLELTAVYCKGLERRLIPGTGWLGNPLPLPVPLPITGLVAIRITS